MRALSLLLALAGLAVSTLLVAWYGAGDVLRAAASIGASGFAAPVAAQLGLFLVLAAAWRAVTPGARFAVLLWGRMVRDSATNCLPFSPVGGFVFGARAITLHGVSWSGAAASTVVDATAEVLAQLVFAWIGLLILLARRPESALAGPLSLALGALGLLAAAALLSRRRLGRLFRGLGRRIAGDWLPLARGRVERLDAELARLYGSPRRLLAGTSLHLAGWIGTAGITWLTYRLLGAAPDFADALAVEALLDALVAATFVVPGAAGVLEAGFAGLGAVFGLPPELSLGVSLLRRAKDLAVGLPVLLAWQGIEMRRLRSKVS